jgi:glycosyltransferase involved in cell wall biosynthesis
LISQPKVSVIIPCYNQGKYLSKAIESVVNQTYRQFEIIVVDDGSDDDTKTVAGRYDQVVYIYQNNQGLAAARNTGIKHCTGSFLVFLDSDDWLIPEALDINISCIRNQSHLALVSGSYMLFYERENKVRKVIQKVNSDNYIHMLQGNYIGMIATVMFQKWVFDIFQYDTSLKVCEDYDLYLKILRRFPAVQHEKLIAVYRMHDKNLSGNHVRMLNTALTLLDSQKAFTKSEIELTALQNGHSSWKYFYSEEMYKDLIHQLFNGLPFTTIYIKKLFRINKNFFAKFMLERTLFSGRRMLRSLMPKFILKAFNKSTAPSPGKVNMGDFAVTRPFSTEFGYDRGGPVDRYYIETFLEKNESLVRGRVLEIGDSEYTLRYGASRVTQSDILHVDDTNPFATFVGDLTNAPHIPGDAFDCIILTQTLHLIYNYKAAIETCFRILKPGGSLLLTVPGISHVGQDQWGKLWHWSFTNNSIARILADYFAKDKTIIETFGNVLSSTAFLYGMGLPELTKNQMNIFDPHYQLIIAALASK